MITWLPRGIACLVLLLPFVPVVAADPDDAEIARLVKQLGDDEFEKREDATTRLKEIGEPALDALHQAMTSSDPEVRRRAGDIVAVIENNICVEQLRLTAGYVGAVSVSADGKRLLTGSIDKTLRLWDADTGKQLRVFEGHTDFALGAALSPDGTRVLSASCDNSVRLWDAQTGKELQKMTGHSKGAYKVAFGPEGQALSSGGEGTMKLWDLNTGQKVGVFVCHTHPGIMAKEGTVAYNEKAKLAVTSGYDQPIRLWNLETGKEVGKVAGTGSRAPSVCFSADGKRLAGCDDDRMLHIWDVGTGNELLRIDDADAYCVAFSADGKRIVSGSYRDGSVRLWDAKTGRELRKYAGHTRPIVACVTFFPDGKRIVSASADGTVRIWRAPK